MEVHVHGFTIDCYFTGAWFYVYDSSGTFALTRTPCTTMFIDLILTFLLREHASEVKQIDAIELNEIVGIHISLTASKVQNIVVVLLSKLWQVVAKMMLVKGILL